MSNYIYIKDVDDPAYSDAIIYFSTTCDDLGLDTETTGLDPHINEPRLLQVSNHSYTYMFDMFTMDVTEICEILDTRSKAKEIKIFAHNFKFDLKMLWGVGIDLGLSGVLDTMNMAKIYTGGSLLSYSLLACCSEFIYKELDKTEQVSDWGTEVLSDSQLDYAAIDPQVTAELGTKLYRLIVKDGLLNTLKLETNVLPAIAAMEFYGVKLDIDKLAELQPIYEKVQDEAEEEFLRHVPERYVRRDILGNVVDKGFNVSSPPQLLEFLRDKGVPNPLLGMRGEEDKLIGSTGSNVLKQLDLDDYPYIPPLLEYRKKRKLLTGYVYSLPDMVNPVTGRIHTHYTQMVSTGRLSSSSPNLQNLARPEKGQQLTIRHCFIPRDDSYVFVGNDYSQIELRVMAELLYTLHQDDTMLKEFLEGRDPYVSTAALLSNTPYTDMVDVVDGEHIVKKAFKTIRQNSKAVRLGYNYGMGAPKFRLYARYQYGVIMTALEAATNRKNYFKGYPGLQKLHDSLRDKKLLKAETFAPFRRVRKWDIYPGPTKLSNHPVQGTAGDILKLAIAWLYKELDKRGYGPCKSWDIMLLLNIHDELIIECKKHLADLAAELSEHYMVKAAKAILKYVPVEAKPCLMPTLADKA